ncbi:unnamed protein product, partial [Closterium sp. NIES-54]
TTPPPPLLFLLLLSPLPLLLSLFPLSLSPSTPPHQVEQACHALSSLAMDDALVTHLVKSDVLAAICSLLLSQQPEILVSVLRVIANLALASDSVAARILNVDSAAILTSLCHHTHMMVRAWGKRGRKRGGGGRKGYYPHVRAARHCQPRPCL